MVRLEEYTPAWLCDVCGASHKSLGKAFDCEDKTTPEDKRPKQGEVVLVTSFGGWLYIFRGEKPKIEPRTHRELHPATVLRMSGVNHSLEEGIDGFLRFDGDGNPRPSQPYIKAEKLSDEKVEELYRRSEKFQRAYCAAVA